jgi:hypothetical protein
MTPFAVTVMFVMMSLSMASAAVRCDDRGCGPYGLDEPEGEAIQDGINDVREQAQHYTLWVWMYGPNPRWTATERGLTQAECEDGRAHVHFRGDALGEQETDPDMEAHRPECLPDGRGQWMMLDEMGKIVDETFASEEECKADVPGRRADWVCKPRPAETPQYWQLRCGYNNQLEDCGAEARTATEQECLLLARRQTDKYGWKDEQYDCIARY